MLVDTGLESFLGNEDDSSLNIKNDELKENKLDLYYKEKNDLHFHNQETIDINTYRKISLFLKRSFKCIFYFKNNSNDVKNISAFLTARKYFSSNV